MHSKFHLTITKVDGYLAQPKDKDILQIVDVLMNVTPDNKSGTATNYE